MAFVPIIKVGDASLFNTMNTPEILNNRKAFGGTFGEFVVEYKKLYEIEYGGSDAGYCS